MWDTGTLRSAHTIQTPHTKHGNLLKDKKEILLIHGGEKLLNDIYIKTVGLTKWSIMVGQCLFVICHFV